MSERAAPHPLAHPGVIGQVSHQRCVVCGQDNAHGLGMTFTLSDDRSVHSEVCCGAEFEGYADQLHGGVIAMLLDGAMTNCLFAHGFHGITGELKIRFRFPVIVGQPSIVRAWIEESSPPFHVMKAELIQHQQVKARATGKFVEQPRREGQR